MLTIGRVVDVLKLGLVGLVFLLMYLGFRILNREQLKDRPHPQVLKRATVFAWQGIVVATIVGAVELAQHFMDRQTSHSAPAPARAKNCLNEVESLDRVAGHPNQTLESLRSAVHATSAACGAEPAVGTNP